MPTDAPVPEGSELEAAALDCYLRVDYRGAVTTNERAYAAYRRAGDRLGAARVARLLAWMNGNVFGEWAVRSGWLARAKTILSEVEGDSAELGWVLLLDAEDEPDPLEKERMYERANALGRTHGDPALEVEGLGWLGLQRAILGRVQEGLQLLDEALAAVVAGEVDDLYVVEGTFCGLFWACERFHDVARAEQWIRAARDLVERRNLVAVGGFCRAHYGGILTAAGRWAEAEVELTEAVRLFEDGYRAMRGAAAVRLAELRIRQGRLDEAEELLEGFDQHPEASRAVAMLHLARGRPAVARDLLERVLGEPLDHDVAGPLLALLVDADLELGDVAAAADAAGRLGRMAEERQATHFLAAAAALARGRVCLASGDSDAPRCLRQALASFALAEMPADLARVRLELARATAGASPEVAIAEATAALAAYQRLDAAREADAAASLLRLLGVRPPPGPRTDALLTNREQEVLTLLGEGLSNGEIAERLYLSRKTVEHHVGRVLAKLGLRNRAEAAAHAARLSRQDSGDV